MELVFSLTASRGLGFHGSLLWGQKGNVGGSGASVTDVARVRPLHLTGDDYLRRRARCSRGGGCPRRSGGSCCSWGFRHEGQHRP